MKVKSEKKEEYENGWICRIKFSSSINKIQDSINELIDDLESVGYRILEIKIGFTKSRGENKDLFIGVDEKFFIIQQLFFHLERGNKEKKGNWLIK